MTTANTMNTSAKSTEEAVAAKTRSNTSDPITAPHHTPPVRRRGTLPAGSVARRRHNPTAPARTTLVRSDNDTQATERDLVASSQTSCRSDTAAHPRPRPALHLVERTLTTRVVGRAGVSDG